MAVPGGDKVGPKTACKRIEEYGSLEGVMANADKVKGVDGQNSHVRNFLYCLKTRALPTFDVEIAHRACTVCHLGNLAYLLKRRLRWDPLREVVVGDDEANRLLDRPKREPWTVS